MTKRNKYSSRWSRRASGTSLRERVFGVHANAPRPTSSAWVWLTGVGAGAAAVYLLDPGRGRRRRAIARDRAHHLINEGESFFGKAMRDARNRAAGLVARVSQSEDDPDDEVLAARVRSVLGHHVSHAHAIDVNVRDGVVTLRGPIIREEVGHLVRAVRRISGVEALDNCLEPHDVDENIPALQGEPAMVRRGGWTPAIRLIAAGAGLMLGVSGRVRRGMVGLMTTMAGGALIARAATNRPLREALGLEEGARGITVRKSITVDAPVEEVYGLWSDPSRLSRFLGHVEEVTPVEGAERRTQWRVRGPGGVPVTWVAEIVEEQPNEHLTWRTVSGRIGHTGTIRFERVDDGTTRVHVRMSYRPPAGSFGHSIAALVGRDPKHTLTEDLQRMKAMLERERRAGAASTSASLGAPMR